VPSKQYQLDQDQRRAMLRIHDQSAHIQESAKDEFFENHSPKELRLEFLQLTYVEQRSELIWRDRA
jgi:hypothetical protein